MAHIITLLSGDGGAGKTTLTAAIGARAAAAGRRVLVVDCSAGYRRLDIALGLESRVLFDAADAASGACPVHRAIVRDGAHALPDLLAAPYDAGIHPDEDLWMSMQESLTHNYDVIIYDTPTGDNVWSTLAARLARRAYVIVQPNDGSMRCTERVLSKLRTEGHDRGDAPSLIINKMDVDDVTHGYQYAPAVVTQTLDAPLASVFQMSDALRLAFAKAELYRLDYYASITRDVSIEMDIDAFVRRVMGSPTPLGWELQPRHKLASLLGLDPYPPLLKEVWA